MKTELIDFDKTRFKKFGGEVIEDVVEYIEDYIKRSNGKVKVIVGCDSQQKRRITLYAVTIVLYDYKLHKGAHVLFLRLKQKKTKDLFTRLMNECVYSLHVAQWLEDKLGYYYEMPEFEKDNYDGIIPTKRVEIHLDVNPHEGRNKQNKSNSVYKSVMGMCTSSGFYTKSKNEAYAASCAADLLVR